MRGVQSEITHIKIPKIAIGEKRPLWSVVIPTYNCASYLRVTLKSVLIQDPGPEQMEVIVVDDHSTKDDPEKVVKESGKNRVLFFRQPQNVGKSRNYALGIAKAKGQYIHLLHGDDTVSDGFYRKMADLFATHPKASAAFCRCDYINAQNQKITKTEQLNAKPVLFTNFLERIAIWQLVQPPSIVFKRIVYETIGTYDLRLKFIEDWEFYVRVALQFQFAYTPETLAQYRVFPENSSSKSAIGGNRVKALQKVTGIIDSYLPEMLKANIKSQRRDAVALYVLGYIPKAIAQNDLKGFWVYSAAFFQYNQRIRWIGRYLRFVFNYKKFL